MPVQGLAQMSNDDEKRAKSSTSNDSKNQKNSTGNDSKKRGASVHGIKAAHRHFGCVIYDYVIDDCVTYDGVIYGCVIYGCVIYNLAPDSSDGPRQFRCVILDVSPFAS